jgi:murein L,D-transpeptidase YcbB/YkuD
MHDTPQKHLFANSVRAESHGCMRVQNPDQLAAAILKQDQNWSQARIASAIADGYDSHVPLRQKIPVYITYFTLKVNEDGSLASFSDLYGHDARMAAALGLSPALPAVTEAPPVQRWQEAPPVQRWRPRRQGFAPWDPQN